MCLILFAHDVHPEYPLILVANRDEYYVRPTQTAEFWPRHPDVLAGRDLQAGGTWLGITRSGRFAAITNFREGEASDALHSRGHLTLDFLRSDRSPAQYLDHLEDRADQYNGFNLLVGQPGELHYFGNRAGRPRVLGAGVYALGNGTLRDNWHKMRRGKRDFESLIDDPQVPGKLLEMMRDETRSRDSELPDTGVGLEAERLLSARFIRADGYGTRASTVVLVSRQGMVSFVEQSYHSDGSDAAARRFSFTLRAEPGAGQATA